ncbi:class I SAM-dependent methyltransferase [Roseateles sp. BYS180W]|uniref:Class I SAM-dependent methyltransferase n=1 Tax=Roseateles rivi TaxID=3299028 RepID=A0ABW7FTY2_9BURK
MLQARIPETDEALQSAEVALAYDQMQRHIRDHGWLREKIELVRSLGVRAGHVLELGPGPGYFGLEWLRAADTPQSRLTALDLAEQMLALAQRNAQDYGLAARCHYQLGNCEHMPFEAQGFDGVISHSSLHEWAQPQRVLAEIHRVLKPGAPFCIVDLRRDLSREAVAFMRTNIPMEMRKGFANSVRAAYTEAELSALLQDSPLAGATVQNLQLGLVASGHRAQP